MINRTFIVIMFAFQCSFDALKPFIPKPQIDCNIVIYKLPLPSPLKKKPFAKIVALFFFFFWIIYCISFVLLLQFFLQMISITPAPQVCVHIPPAVTNTIQCHCRSRMMKGQIGGVESAGYLLAIAWGSCLKKNIKKREKNRRERNHFLLWKNFFSDESDFEASVALALCFNLLIKLTHKCGSCFYEPQRNQVSCVFLFFHEKKND